MTDKLGKSGLGNLSGAEGAYRGNGLFYYIYTLSDKEV